MLTDKDQKMMAMFEKQLAVPKWKYILIYGVLIFGTCVLLGIIGVRYFMNNQSLQQQWDNKLWVDMLFMPVAGIAFGWFTRRQAERNYEILKKKAQSQ